MSCVFSDCIDCKYFNSENKKIETCEAFPNGIPKEWFWSKSESNRDVTCNNEIKFEPLSEHI